MDLKLGAGSKAGDFLSGKREGGREKGEGERERGTGNLCSGKRDGERHGLGWLSLYLVYVCLLY